MSTQEFEILRAQNEAIVKLGELIVELQMAAKALLERLESLDRRVKAMESGMVQRN